MKDYLSKWTIPRIIQLIVGVFFLSDYLSEGGRFGLVFGLIMFGQAVFNVGCFSSRGCSTDVASGKDDGTVVSNEVEVEYEEI